MNDSCYKIGNITVGAKPIVEVTISFTRGDELVDSVTGKFDFSNLDPSLHELALMQIKQCSCNIMLPIPCKVIDTK